MKLTFFLLFFVSFPLFSQETGCISGNCENDKGVYIYTNGFKYEGQFANGLREGRGKLITPDGETYDGMWAKDAFNGQGTYIWASGAKYTGEWKNGVRDGYGIYFYGNSVMPKTRVANP